MTDQDKGKVVRLVLRNPSAEHQVEDLSAVPESFDKMFSKPYYAHQLRLAGHDWPYIAHKLHYSSAQGAENAVRNWLAKATDGRAADMIRAEAVALDLERLDALQAAYWEDALRGDLPAAQFCLRVINQRANLVQPGSAPVSATVTNNTLVVGGTEAQYVASLMKARDALVGPAARPDDEAAVVESEQKE